ncbi:MAG: D-alanine--D-alanine ligase [Desulfarculaceae bacterium]|nr:D-alanine--D-alanine ligase [Desulfarculaceae bacterium]MCF8074379.1 D-alanine--D-alanine ligase [Desulfarculaceae bacterium]MCF8103818.1 D-alanine--D-alanine ligase [Desulfarculaceae bacterium]MCF8118157.1 D-alanine--D-alanine ligase [Desulfarculaceae bacterium]
MSARVLKVALIMGGTSSEREVSLASGGACAKAMRELPHQVEVFDPATDLPRLVDKARDFDVALVMLHGPGGEDGRLQGLLDLLGLPYQCAGVLGCALAMDKPRAKELFRAAGIPVARDLVLRRGQDPDPAGRVLDQLGLPVVIKPAREGSSFGISLVHARGELPPALDKAFGKDQVVLAERLLQGRELTAAVLGNRELTALPLVEIIPGESHQFFDFEAKYTPGASREVCPAEVDSETTALVQKLGLEAHRALGLKGYSRTDFILTDQGPFALETNTIPGMTETSLLPQAAAAAGMSFAQTLDRLLELALEE